MRRGWREVFGGLCTRIVVAIDILFSLSFFRLDFFWLGCHGLGLEEGADVTAARFTGTWRTGHAAQGSRTREVVMLTPAPGVKTESVRG